MSTGRLLRIAGAVLVLAVIGGLIRPLLSSLDPSGRDNRAPLRATAPLVAPAVLDVATRAAAEAVACQPAWPRRAACGELRIARSEGYPSGPTAMVVLLVGTVHTPTGGSVPISLRVALADVDNRWRSTVMSP